MNDTKEVLIKRLGEDGYKKYLEKCRIRNRITQKQLCPKGEWIKGHEGSYRYFWNSNVYKPNTTKVKQYQSPNVLFDNKNRLIFDFIFPFEVEDYYKFSRKINNKVVKIINPTSAFCVSEMYSKARGNSNKENEHRTMLQSYSLIPTGRPTLEQIIEIENMLCSISSEDC